MEVVEVAVASDANYFCGLLVTVASVAINASRDCALRFHVLDGGISEDDLCLLQTQIVKLHPHVEIIRHQVDDRLFEGFPPWAGQSKMTYARLLLPKLLPDVSHVVYIDCDILWTRDILQLWNRRTKEIVFHAVRENWPYIDEKESGWFRAKGLKFVDGEYVTAGMSFFNLDEFRRQKLDERAFDFLDCHRDVQWVDQTALNAVLWAENAMVERLTADWACTVWLMTPEILKTKPVFHFAGGAPWKVLVFNRLLTDAVLHWFKTDAQVRGCSTWRSLRRYYTPLMIVSSRAFYLVGSSGRLGRFALFALLRVIGKGSAFDSLKAHLWRI